MHVKHRSLFISVLLVGLLLTGCNSNPADHDGETDHFEADAMLVLAGTDTLLYQHELDGVLANNDINITENAASDTIEVFFESHDGEIFQPLEDHYSLQAAISDTTIASVDRFIGKWKIIIQGNSSGSTVLSVQLMHDDHAGFTGQPIPVIVSN